MPHSQYLPDLMGTATVAPTGEFEAGSYQEFSIIYAAGKFGIDDSGSIKLVHRFASDMGRVQMTDPKGSNYLTAKASNGAVLDIQFNVKQNIRPWDKTIYIKVVRGFLREGDTIEIVLGDKSEGSPGIRLQTFCEDSFEFRVLVDAIATYNYVELPKPPIISIVSGPPVLWKAILPTERSVGELFKLSLKGEDKWGNPSDKGVKQFSLHANSPVIGLPESIKFEKGQFVIVINELSCSKLGDLEIKLANEGGDDVACSNPLRISEKLVLTPYWGDLHGQSEETIGTNSARDFFEFARDKAFLDVCCHQGNDFQITNEFWKHLNQLTKEFTEDGKFITYPGYEWSGNTSMGGDRNVLFMNEGQQIHRSSHALVDDLSDQNTDAHTATELFTKLKDEDCHIFAHIGGRYADIKMAHDDKLERSVEVHSAWGTFEWLIHDAFEQGYRVGIMSNSDGHKGRPGASHPGSTSFGSYGGLTCMLAPELTRSGIMHSLKSRHHYGTTGCRMYLNTTVNFDNPANKFFEDPNLGPTSSELVSEAMMGDILSSKDAEVTFNIEAYGSAPIERIEIRNGLKTLEIFRPFDMVSLGNRIRVIWEGSEYRGRGRETCWDGSATLSDNSFVSVTPINHYNISKFFDQTGPGRLEWEAITTGGFGGFEAVLEHSKNGVLKIDTALVKEEIQINQIGLEDLVFENGGISRRIRVFRLPENNSNKLVKVRRKLPIVGGQDNAFYVCIVQEDGHYIWSSPTYIFREGDGI